MNDEYIKNVKNDRFAQLLGIEIVEAYPGYALVELEIGEKHKNGIDIVQGGVIFTLAIMRLPLRVMPTEVLR